MSEQAAIDAIEFARHTQRLGGDVAVSSLTRLQDLLYEGSGTLNFSISGMLDAENKPLLRVRICGKLHLTCQRCLGLLVFPLALDRSLLLVAEETALQDVSEEDDAIDSIVAETKMNVLDLIEDEILLAIPMSPRHDESICGGNLSDNVGTGKQSAFAVLSKLKHKH